MFFTFPPWDHLEVADRLPTHAIGCKHPSLPAWERMDIWSTRFWLRCNHSIFPEKKYEVFWQFFPNLNDWSWGDTTWGQSKNKYKVSLNWAGVSRSLRSIYLTIKPPSKNSKSKSNISYSYDGLNRQSMKHEVGWKWPPFTKAPTLRVAKCGTKPDECIRFVSICNNIDKVSMWHKSYI